MKKQITTPIYAMQVHYLNCPHCGKMILAGTEEDMKLISKWKKQKYIKPIK